tara:strand:+ start:195 stop:455 length:261 start_codon:yes stop_codon:yes gene_type:complete
MNDDKQEEHDFNREEFKLHSRKVLAQRRMATTALIVMTIFTAFLLTPLIPIDRINAISDLSGMFYITMGGIIAAYMGVAAWMEKKK